MPRRGGGRSSSPPPRRQSPPPRQTTTAQQPMSQMSQPPAKSGGMFSGLGSTLMTGMAFGAGSEVAHQAIRGVMGSGSDHNQGQQQQSAQQQGQQQQQSYCVDEQSYFSKPFLSASLASRNSANLSSGQQNYSQARSYIVIKWMDTQRKIQRGFRKTFKFKENPAFSKIND